MIDIDTLIVFATNRGPTIALDQLEALDWSCALPHFTVVVDDRGDLPEAPSDTHAVIRSKTVSAKKLSGFKNHEGIQHALRTGTRFQRVLCIDDDLLPIGRGLDAWAANLMDDRAVDLLGVEDRERYREHWPYYAQLFAEWVPEAKGFVPFPETLFYSAIWLSLDFVQALDERGLLVPEGYERWSSWPDVYISWMAQVLGFTTHRHGSMDAPLPPLYANHPDTMRGAPQPWLLHGGFLAYHSTRSVPAFTESQVRAHYHQARRGV